MERGDAKAVPEDTVAFEEDDDDVDLSFAGPEPVPAAPWHLRFLDLASAYLPLILMAVLAAGTWWLVRNAPVTEVAAPAPPPRHEPDYEMTRFVIQRFGPDGQMRTQIEGERARHFPDDDTLEIDQARIRAVGSDGSVTIATARRALANGDGSEIQLIGDANVTRPAAGKAQAIEFRSDFLHAFRNVERVRSHLPVVVTQGTSVVRAQGLEYDNLVRVVELKGRSNAVFSPPRRASAP
jgi:lipopolysaccharide export system protein LptC